MLKDAVGDRIEVKVIVLCAAGFFISLVTVLNIVHCTNFMLGKTTNERFAASKRVTQESLSEELRTVSSKGSRRTDTGGGARKRSTVVGSRVLRGSDPCFVKCISMCCDRRMIDQDQIVRKLSVLSVSQPAIRS